jgi:hypothetical protein
MSTQERYLYDEDKWGEPIDLTDKNDLNARTVNGYIMYCL